LALAIRGGEPVRKKPWPRWPIHGDRELELLREVLESSFWRGGVGEPGPWEREFEERFSRKYGCAYSSLVSNGTFALYAALVSLGIGVWISLGLILLIKPFSSASPPSGSPFHRDPYHRAPPARGDPYPKLHLHRDLRFIAVGKPPHPGLHIEI